MDGPLADGTPLSGGKPTDKVDLKAVDASGLTKIPMFAHTRHAAAQGARDRFLRRPYSYDEPVGPHGSVAASPAPATSVAGATSNAGLLFITFQRDIDEQFVPVQKRLEKPDLLNKWTTPIGSAVFAILPGCRAGEIPWPGAADLACLARPGRAPCPLDPARTGRASCPLGPPARAARPVRWTPARTGRASCPHGPPPARAGRLVRMDPARAPDRALQRRDRTLPRPLTWRLACRTRGAFVLHAVLHISTQQAIAPHLDATALCPRPRRNRPLLHISTQQVIAPHSGADVDMPSTAWTPSGTSRQRQSCRSAPPMTNDGGPETGTPSVGTTAQPRALPSVGTRRATALPSVKATARRRVRPSVGTTAQTRALPGVGTSARATALPSVKATARPGHSQSVQAPPGTALPSVRTTARAPSRVGPMRAGCTVRRSRSSHRRRRAGYPSRSLDASLTR